MSRFEIQEMVAQSEQGVTYLAHDKQSKQDVALRRFFPFGPSGGGLEGDAAKDYSGKCQIFTNVTHPALRAVIDGGVDSSDKTPYLVTEWVEGQPLIDVLGDAKLDPARAMDVARNALEVSLELSKVFGKQGVWIDTDPNSIVVGSQNSGRGFTFWVGLSRWFGLRPKQREVHSIAILVEQLVGWDSKVYTKDSAGGFGGWVKSLKQSPAMSLEQALEQLSVIGKQGHTASAAAKSSPSAQANTQPVAVAAAPTQVAKGSGPTRPLQSTSQALSSNPTQQGQSQPMPLASKPAAWRKPLIVMAACLTVAGLIAVLVQKNNDAVRRQLAKNEAVEKANEEARAAARVPASSLNDEGPIRNISTQGQPVRTRAVVAGPQTASPTPGASESAEPPLFNPDDTQAIGKLEPKTPVRLRGTLRGTSLAGGKNVHLNFTSPYQGGQIRGVASPRDFEGKPDLKMFESYIGKDITLDGFYEYYAPSESHFVNLTRLDQITVNGSNPEPVKPQAVKPTEKVSELTPGDIQLIEKLPHDRPVRIIGIVEKVRNPGNAKSIHISFAEPKQGTKIKVIIGSVDSAGKPVPHAEIGSLARDLGYLRGKKVAIDGVVSAYQGKPAIRATGADKIKVVK